MVISPSLLIIEPYATGHRMQYVRRIVSEAIAQGKSVTVATRRETIDHPVFQAMREESDGGFETLLLPEEGKFTANLKAPSDVRMQKAHFEQYKAFHQGLSREMQSVPVLVPYLNLCDKAIAILGSPFGTAPWGGIVMRDTFHHQSMGVVAPSTKSDKIKEVLFRRLLSNPTLAALFSIDDVLLNYVQQRLPRLSGKFHYAADPVEMRGTIQRDAARKRFGIPEDVPVLLVYGAISERKGIAELLQATVTEGFPANIHILLAGEQNARARAILSEPIGSRLKQQGRLIEATGYLDDETEYATFQASDVVWVGYRQHYGSSGVILQAAAMGLPVLSCREGLLGWRTQKYRIGEAVDIADPRAVTQAAQKLCCDMAFRAECRVNGLQLARLHTSQAFGGTILNALLCAEK